MSNLVSPAYLAPSIIVATLALITGSWLLMRTLRSWSSKGLFACLALTPVWTVTSEFVLGRFIKNEDQDRNLLLQLYEVPFFGVCLLAVLASILFLIVAIQIARSNNSFKPAPLRGAA